MLFRSLSFGAVALIFYVSAGWTGREARPLQWLRVQWAITVGLAPAALFLFSQISVGRVWQCGTMQVDFSMPGLLGAEYVGEDNARHVPVMLHRAIVGSMERFLGILIEHFAGAFPLWLAPEQVVVMNISEHQADYARSVADALRKAGFRAFEDLRNEKISYKIREHSLQKLPYQLVVGDKEKQAGTVAVRTRGGEDLGAMAPDAFTARLRNEAGA